MLYDRPYMREPQYRPSALKPLYWLLGSMVAVFFLQNLFLNWFQSRIIYDLFALSKIGIERGFIWSFVSYGFLHGSFFHILMNGIIIYMVGKILLGSLGVEKFFTLYGLSILLGGIIWFAVNTWKPSGHLVGASGGLMGLIAAFCLSNPNQPILFWFIRTTPKQLLTVMIIFDLVGFLLNELAPFGSGVAIAHSAHLGGALGGWVFVKFILHKDFSFGKPNIKPPSWFKSKKTSMANTGRFRINFTNRKELQKEVDRILDKITVQGFGSLTEEERKTLDKAKEMLNK
jgi:membrane associated rhomboid family serine protease